MLTARKVTDVFTIAEYEKALEGLDAPISYEEFRLYALEHAPTVTRFGQRHHSSNQAQAPRQAPEPRRVTQTVIHQPTYLPPPGPPPAPQHSAAVNQGPARAREPDVIPMDVDRARARQTGACYKCGQLGHIARDCRSRELKHVVRGLSDDQFASLDFAVRVRVCEDGEEVKVVSVSRHSSQSGQRIQRTLV